MSNRYLVQQQQQQKQRKLAENKLEFGMPHSTTDIFIAISPFLSIVYNCNEHNGMHFACFECFRHGFSCASLPYFLYVIGIAFAIYSTEQPFENDSCEIVS